MMLFFSRLAPGLIGIEACAEAHYWARQLTKLGHEVRLKPPSYVKPFVKRGKTDAADAEAICTAVIQPTMRFVPVKTEVQQAMLMSHRTRDFLVRQLTQLANAIRAHLGEFGLVVPKGVHNMGRLVAEAEGAVAWRGPSGQCREQAKPGGPHDAPCSAPCRPTRCGCRSA